LVGGKRLEANSYNQTHDDTQKCSGMYSKKSWGGKVEPFINIKFIRDDRNKDVQNPTVAVVIWEWKDTLLLGKPSDKPENEVGCLSRLPDLTDTLTARIHLQ
jgi:hypothetical protein